MWVWISTCGKYYAVPREDKGNQDCDVYSVDGKQSWLSKRYVPKGFDDTDPRFLYPEFPHMVSSYSRLHPLRGGSHAFSLGFGDYDTNVKIIPWTGNTELKSYKADFEKRVNIKKRNILFTKLTDSYKL
jgi:hypothetical protein